MNDQMNRIENVEKFIHEKTNSIPIILYPGDIWSGKEKIDNSLSINKYTNDLQKNLELYDDPKIIDFDELRKLASAYIDNIKKRNNSIFIKLLHKLHFFKTTNIFMKDLKISL